MSFLEHTELNVKTKEPLYKLFYLGFCIYAIPPICFLLSIIQLAFWPELQMLFWVYFLLSILPAVVLGFFVSLIGWIISTKKEKIRNIKIGRKLTFLGGIGILLGLFAWLLLYVVTS